jgi:pimeloyl-ACP methyl ester carboxylesterase
MSIYVLVHGAWHGAWCWHKVAPLLRSAGHIVYTPDLPGHGERQSSDRRITAGDYVDSVHDLVAVQDRPVILLGHSMAGMVISRVADLIPDRIRTLVYLSGFLLENGQSINDFEGRVEGSLVAANLILSSDKSTFSLPEHIVRSGLYGDCNDKDYNYGLAHLQPQPIQPFLAPLTVSETRYGSVQRVYIECTQDQALPIAAQRQMYENSRCEKIYSLNASHSAFFSRYNELVEVLLQL